MTSKDCIDECPNCGGRNLMFRSVEFNTEIQEVDLNYTCRNCCQEFTENYKVNYAKTWYEEEPFNN